jgi:hypothetical protein
MLNVNTSGVSFALVFRGSSYGLGLLATHLFRVDYSTVGFPPRRNLLPRIRQEQAAGLFRMKSVALFDGTVIRKYARKGKLASEISMQFQEMNTGVRIA